MPPRHDQDGFGGGASITPAPPLKSEQLMRELNRQRVERNQEPRRIDVIVNVEMSEEAEKFIQVAGVKVRELGV